MTISPTSLRADLYGVLDRVIASGEPVLVRRGTATLRICLVEEGPALSAPAPLRTDLVVGDADALVSGDWGGDWAAGKDL